MVAVPYQLLQEGCQEEEEREKKYIHVKGRHEEEGLLQWLRKKKWIQINVIAQLSLILLLRGA